MRSSLRVVFAPQQLLLRVLVWSTACYCCCFFVRAFPLDLFNAVLATTAQDEFGKDEQGFNDAIDWQTRRVSTSGVAAPFIGCADYHDGRQLRVRLENMVGVDSVRTVHHSRQHGSSCFIFHAVHDGVEQLLRRDGSNVGTAGQLQQLAAFPANLKVGKSNRARCVYIECHRYDNLRYDVAPRGLRWRHILRLMFVTRRFPLRFSRPCRFPLLYWTIPLPQQVRPGPALVGVLPLLIATARDPGDSRCNPAARILRRVAPLPENGWLTSWTIKSTTGSITCTLHSRCEPCTHAAVFLAAVVCSSCSTLCRRVHVFFAFFYPLAGMGNIRLKLRCFDT